MKCLVLSDIHANWSALQAILASESDADQILCLGDLVNYGPQPAECVSWAMNLNPPNRIIQGNHDRDFAWDNDPHCAPKNYPFAKAMSEVTNSLLTVEMKRFLAELQPAQEFRWNNTSCFACHLLAKGPLVCPFEHQSPKWPWESDIVLVGLGGKPFTLVGHPDVLFVAHTHVPFKANWGTTLVVNPGSVGLPADGDPRTEYAIWRDGEVEFHRLAYDIEKTIHAYDVLDLNTSVKEQLIASLRSGTRWANTNIAKPAKNRERSEPCRV